MKKYIFQTLVIVVIAVLIFSSRYFVFTKQVVDLKPMSDICDVSINQVRENVIAIFSDGKFHDLNFDIGYSDAERKVKHVTDKENRNHFFINWFGWDSSGEDSEIYYNWWGKLKLIPCYHIILDSMSINRTRITIESFPKVMAGTDFSLNHLFPYATPRRVSVQPSSIEEYRIIRMIQTRGKTQ